MQFKRQKALYTVDALYRASRFIGSSDLEMLIMKKFNLVEIGSPNQTFWLASGPHGNPRPILTAPRDLARDLKENSM